MSRECVGRRRHGLKTLLLMLAFMIGVGGRECSAKEGAGNVLEDSAVELPLLEQLFAFEENKHHTSIIITGIAEEYQDDFWTYMDVFAKNYHREKNVILPADINGLPVKEIGENAFRGMKIDELTLPASLVEIADGAFKDTGILSTELPGSVEDIGESAFENCNFESLEFPDSVKWIKERAFAGNKALWTVLVRDKSTEIEKEAFAGCKQPFLLCYGEDGRRKENLVKAYAEENGIEAMEIILFAWPIVNYHQEPLVLTPEVRNFFHGMDGDYEKEEWCSWEENEDAPNFGYDDWQWDGCSSWCGVLDFTLEVEASSELASKDGRYCADHVTVQNRDAAWAEGAEGNGVGESIVYRQSCVCGTDNKWEGILQWDSMDPKIDGFLRYSEICIVNGYAKDEKAWEENGRIKQLLMYVGNKPYAYLELEDTIYPQYFKLPEDDIKIINGGMLEVRYEITQVYPGSLYEDTCLTGLVMEFTGRYAH